MFKKHRQDIDLSWTFTYDVTFLSVALMTITFTFVSKYLIGNHCNSEVFVFLGYLNHEI